ncbi:T9SS type A sorting domain-containing protein [Taibaiella lutea]|uniref:T9SS type A sorting domain-containing protein n=1 Tax=Taibaiella lutea TaxID=2608001 RepID=A0A5M6CQ96_9BACT|nr:GEVED domain-containing protein [Taibaiella lutea]KAA5537451.1 T9SS type A sorting domain-containing protein [Taibaiella lutea]
MKNFTLKSKHLTKKVASLLGIAMLATTQVDAQYCAATNNSTSSYYITNVSTTGGSANISNMGTTFTAGGYADYTSQYVTVLPGGTFTLTSAAGPSGYTYMWNVFCDWNYDGDFADAGENVYTISSYVNSITTTITVPAATSLGNVRMRIRAAYISPAPPACGDNTWGEAEDYTVKVLPLNNIALRSLISPPDTPFCSNVTLPVSVMVYNHGSNAINTANIKWTVDGVAQTPATLPTPLLNTNDSVAVTLGNFFFSDASTKVFKIWGESPNGVNDTYHADDSVSKSITTLLGVEVHIAPRDTTICQGTSITLDAGTHPKNPIYIWNNATLTQTMSVSNAGVYSVKVQNTDGCFDYDTITVLTYPNPLVNSIAMIDNADGSYTFNAIGAQNITTYLWNFGDGQTQPGTGIPGQIIHQYIVAGEYDVTLTLSNDCGSIQTVRRISTQGIPTGIGNVSRLQQEISVFPNPSKSVVTISNTAKIKINSLSVFNIMGQKVYENGKVNAEKYEMNISSLAVGIYNVVIDTEEGRVTKKLEVIR